MLHNLKNVLSKFEKDIYNLHTEFDLPDNAKENWRCCFFQLRSNNLRVFAISNPKSTKAAAAMNVGVGNWSDPEDFPGIAHFCEHMLFMGTKKFPEENHYQKFLSENGGYSNAFTASESTNYYFNIGCEYFPEAVDIFAQFFKEPLMNEDSTERELQAVNSEHLNNLQNDYWRSLQLRKAIANPNHPFSKFGTGNIDTLTAREDSQRSVRDALLKFHKEHYFASRMNLCLVSNHNIEDLVELAIKQFGDIVDGEDTHLLQFKSKEDPSVRLIPPAFSANETQKIIKSIPIKDYHLLRVYFPTDSSACKYTENPSGYLSHLFGHEGKGSIFYILQKQGWADELSAGSMTRSSDFDLFTVSISLTLKGMNYIDEIIALIFRYAKLIHDEQIPRWVFDELQSMGDISFKFEEEMEPENLSIKLTSTMSHPFVPPNHFYRFERFDNFNQDLIKEYLNNITPENMLLNITSKLLEDQTNLEEKWYGTKYSLSDFSSSQLQLWKTLDVSKAESDESRAVLEDLFSKVHLPHRNPFIMHIDELSLVSDRPEIIDDSKPKSRPVRIINEDRLTVFHKVDDVFFQPKTVAAVLLQLDIAYQSVETSLMLNLLCSMIEEELNDISYHALVFQTKFSMVSTFDGILFSFSGLSPSVEKLIPAVFEAVSKFIEDDAFFASVERKQSFELHRENLKKSTLSSLKHNPYYIAMLKNNELIYKLNWPISRRLAVIDDLTHEKLQSLRSLLLQRSALKVLLHGNISHDRACSFSHRIFDTIGRYEKIVDFTPITNLTLRIPSSLELNGKKGMIYNDVLCDAEQQNCAIYFSMQCCVSSPKNDAIMEVISDILNEPIFDTLRTKQQLGYTVASRLSTTQGVIFFSVIIQSTKPPLYLSNAINEMITSFFNNEMLNMTDEAFGAHKNSVVIKKSQKDRELITETNRYWDDIIANTFVFERKEILIEEIKKVTKDEIIEMYKTAISDNPDRKLLVIAEYTDAAFKEHKEDDDADFLVLSSEEYAKEQFGFMEFPPAGWIPHSSI